MTLATLTLLEFWADSTFYIIISSSQIISIGKQSLFLFPKKHTFWKTSRLLTSIIELFTPYHFTKLTRNETHNVKLQIHSRELRSLESLWLGFVSRTTTWGTKDDDNVNMLLAVGGTRDNGLVCLPFNALAPPRPDKLKRDSWCELYYFVTAELEYSATATGLFVWPHINFTSHLLPSSLN